MAYRLSGFLPARPKQASRLDHTPTGLTSQTIPTSLAALTYPHFAIDVNVLLHASDTGSVHNEVARRFLEHCAGGSEVFYLAWPTVMSYLRIATHPSIFSRPLTVDEAMANVDAHLAALLKQHGIKTLYTCDRDFRKFDFLKTRNPFS